MHDTKTAKLQTNAVKPDPVVPGQEALRTKRLQARHRRLEVLELFDAAEDLGLKHLAGHVLAEDRLDFVTDQPFDGTDDEEARVEQAAAEGR